MSLERKSTLATVVDTFCTLERERVVVLRHVCSRRSVDCRCYFVCRLLRERGGAYNLGVGPVTRTTRVHLTRRQMLPAPSLDPLHPTPYTLALGPCPSVCEAAGCLRIPHHLVLPHRGISQQNRRESSQFTIKTVKT